ncbi:MAG: hypothetical protein JO257_30595 [Deltaproteobacteria bacterium]|nr:hypothetical protein [Deltaproteobacteria bacterium]
MRALAVLLALAACGQDKIDAHATGTADYNHKALLAAVDGFVAKGRTADAYGELAATIRQLRPGMDRSVAHEAELRLVVLALGPVRAQAGKPLRAQIDSLALTVWPTLLAPPVEEDKLLVVRDLKAPELVPKPGEDADAYLLRLCGGPLAADCKHVVPEQQGEVIRSLAYRHGVERTRNAILECQPCQGEGADPGWHAAVLQWEEIDRASAETIVDTERAADPDNWPLAGAASEDDPELPEAELSPRGDIIVGGHAYGPNQLRIDVLRELRGKSDVIALHLHPDTTLAQAKGVLLDARKAGATRVAVIAREPTYPYRRRAYWIAAGTGLRANLRASDSLQLLLHAIDEVAGPGTVARVD